MYKYNIRIRRLFGTSARRFEAVTPQNSKAVVLEGEARRRELEALRRQKRFDLWEGFHALVDEFLSSKK